MLKKKLFLGSASATVLSFASAAVAQTAPAPQAVAPAPTATEAGQAPTNEVGTAQPTPNAAGPGAPDTEIVVTGIRSSLAAAEKIKRNSDQIVDAIVAQDIGKFPDNTVAAALQRVPGVQVVVGDNNEIVNPLVRGLGDILTTLNGREVFTGAGRGFSFQDLPAEALAGAQVYKNNSANLLEGGVAGVINLDLHRPFDFKGLTVAGGVRNSYAVNNKESYPAANLLVADRFDTGIGEIGVLLAGTYASYKFDRPVAFDDLLRSGNHGPGGSTGGGAGAFIPTGVGGLNQFGHYTRPELNGSVQWQASDDLQVYGDALWAGYRNRSSTAFLINDAFSGTSLANVKLDNNCHDYLVNGAGFNGSASDPGSNVEHLCNTTSYSSFGGNAFTSDQAHDQKTDDYIFGGGLKFNHDRLHLNLDVSYDRSVYYSKTFIIDIGKKLPELDITTNDNGGVNFQAPGNPLGNPSGFLFTNGLDDDRLKSTGTLFATAFDGSYDVGGFLPKIDFGARYAKRDGRYEEVIVNPAAPGGPYVTPVDGQGLPANFLQPVPGVPRIYGGATWLQPSIGALLNEGVEDQLRSLFNVPQGDQPYDPTRSFQAKEETYTGYAQAHYKVEFGGPIVLDGLAGVRISRTDRSISGTGRVANPDNTVTLNPVSRHTSDTDVLPNASARLALGGGLQFRASYAKVLARPDFGSLNPGLNYAVSTNANIQNGGNQGNPDLKPEKADEYDATAEYYFGKSNYLSAAVYLKNITNRIVTSGILEPIGGINYLINTPRNLGEARLKGVEASAQYFFDWLPGPLAGIGAFGNFTYADSKVRTRTDPLFNTQLIGVSKYNYNAGLIYEKYGVSFRAVYTFRSKWADGDNTSSVNIRPIDQAVILDTVRPNGRLDFSFNYDVTKNVTVTLDGTNVNRSKYKSYYYDSLNPHDIRFDDTTYSVGVRFRF